MRTAPNTLGAFAVRARARSMSLSSVRMRAWCYVLVDHCFPCACTASKARFCRYSPCDRTCTVYKTGIVVSLSVRIRMVCNTKVVFFMLYQRDPGRPKNVWVLKNGTGSQTGCYGNRTYVFSSLFSFPGFEGVYFIILPLYTSHYINN